MTTNMMLEQAKRDREADQTILRDMIQAGIKDEGVLLTMLVKKGKRLVGPRFSSLELADPLAEEQQEAIKTLQRALDRLTEAQARTQNPALAHSPQGSPTDTAPGPGGLYGSTTGLAIGMPASETTWLPTGHSTTGSFVSGYSTSHFSVQAETGDSLRDDRLKMMSEAVSDQEMATTIATARMKSVRAASVPEEQIEPERQFIEKALHVSEFVGQSWS